MRKLIFSLVTLAFLFSTLVTNTMAWFQLNREVSVAGFEMNVYTGKAIALSITGGNANYVSSLGTNDIKKAIVAKYMNYEFDADANLIRTYRDASNALQQAIVTESEIDAAFAEIELTPVTSSNGYDFTNRYGTDIVPTDGFYVSFDLYFKADNSVSTGLQGDRVNIYLYSGVDKTLENGVVIKPFSITNEDDTVNINHNMTCYDKVLGTADVLNVNNISTITANAKNALRISTIAELNGEDDNKIFELYEGYGSYATELSETNYSLGYTSGTTNYSSPSTYLAKYDSSKNAAYTYLTNRTGEAPEKMSYNSIPYTVKNFDSVENARVTSITQVGQESKVTFNFWIEGNDADCFDGIGQTDMTVTMSFTTVKQENCSVDVEFYDEDNTTKLFEYELCNVGKTITPYNALLKAGRKFLGWQTELGEFYDQSAELLDILYSVNNAKADAGTPVEELDYETLKLFAVYSD